MRSRHALCMNDVVNDIFTERQKLSGMCCAPSLQTPWKGGTEGVPVAPESTHPCQQDDVALGGVHVILPRTCVVFLLLGCTAQPAAVLHA